MNINRTDTANGIHLEPHTLYPYQNSDSCNTSDDTVPVKVFRARSVSDIRKSRVLKGEFVKNSLGYEIKLFVRNNSLRLYTNEGYLTIQPGHPLIKEHKWLHEVLLIILDSVTKRKNFIPNPIKKCRYFLQSQL
jgi:hypothetical protein